MSSVLVEPGTFILRPRHERRVESAARRVGMLDECGSLEDWSLAWLKQCRRSAISAGHERNDVDDWTMNGVLAGREVTCG